MKLSEQTQEILKRIEVISARKFSFADEVGMLIDVAHRSHQERLLADLSFHAKFAHKVHGMMQRIGRDADGYEKLLREFGESVSTAKRLATDLLKHSPEVSTHFDSQFFSLTPVAFQDLLSLFRDLSCYKNYLIDTPAKQSLS